MVKDHQSWQNFNIEKLTKAERGQVNIDITAEHAAELLDKVEELRSAVDPENPNCKVGWAYRYGNKGLDQVSEILTIGPQTNRDWKIIEGFVRDSEKEDLYIDKRTIVGDLLKGDIQFAEHTLDAQNAVYDDLPIGNISLSENGERVDIAEALADIANGKGKLTAGERDLADAYIIARLSDIGGTSKEEVDARASTNTQHHPKRKRNDTFNISGDADTLSELRGIAINIVKAEQLNYGTPIDAPIDPETKTRQTFTENHAVSNLAASIVMQAWMSGQFDGSIKTTYLRAGDQNVSSQDYEPVLTKLDGDGTQAQHCDLIRFDIESSKGTIGFVLPAGSFDHRLVHKLLRENAFDGHRPVQEHYSQRETFLKSEKGVAMTQMRDSHTTAEFEQLRREIHTDLLSSPFLDNPGKVKAAALQLNPGHIMDNVEQGKYGQKSDVLQPIREAISHSGLRAAKKQMPVLPAPVLKGAAVEDVSDAALGHQSQQRGHG